MEKAKVSVIIPVYNVEQYIEKCITSVIDQTYTDLEIIIIEDCSTDNSFDICKKYAEADNRIKLFRNEINSGVSFSRNRALKIVTGDFVCMIDSDDWVENNYIELMLKNIESNNADACICGYFKYFESDKKIQKFQIVDKTSVVAKMEILNAVARKRSPFVGYICAKMYRTSIIRTKQLSFDATISLFEDSLFNYSYFDSVSSCVIIEECLYHYRIRSGSLTTSVTPERIKTKLYAVQKALNIAKKYPDSLFYRRVNAAIFGTSMQYANAVVFARELSQDEYKEIMIIAKEAFSQTKIRYTRWGELVRYCLFRFSPGFAKIVLRVKMGK